jgi:hypothetical protein
VSRRRKCSDTDWSRKALQDHSAANELRLENALEESILLADNNNTENSYEKIIEQCIGIELCIGNFSR